MSKRRKLLILGGSFLLYNIVSGGGILIERSDSLATLGSVAEAELTDEAGVYLKQTPTTTEFYIPFVFSYVRHTYPFQLRFYGSTRDSSTRVTEADMPGSGTDVVVTGVRWYRKTDGNHAPEASAVYHGSTWNGVSIPEPGEWVIESDGFVSRDDGEKEMLTFPTMTVRPTIRDRFRVTGLLYYMLSNLPV
ncbi:MAG: hypothetical protein M3552_21840 [Planctomycetota bacterium]|nr:hypothetical protein [Planctomycetota bacterium]